MAPLAQLVSLGHAYLPLIIAIIPLGTVVVVACQRRAAYWLSTSLSACWMLLGGYLFVRAYQGAAWGGHFPGLYLPGNVAHDWLPCSFRVDFTVAALMSLTTTIGFITHCYTLVYLQAMQQRYWAYTGCFISATLFFLMTPHLIVRFISGEIMGWMSYLLVIFWYPQKQVAQHGTKVWLTNQLGSMCLLIGILAMGSQLGSFDLEQLKAVTSGMAHPRTYSNLPLYFLLVGLLVKTAQFPWCYWLPSAMAAPTPASALMHTTTMVGAAVYWLADVAPLLDTTMHTWVAYVGSLTTFTGAYTALTQPHLKQVLAYSTLSQIGYAVIAIGTGASHAGIYHLITHAFGKACLMLCVGTITHCIRQQDSQVRAKDLGGLLKTLPITFLAYLLAACSLAGIPGFAGASSKEIILTYAWTWAKQQATMGMHMGYGVPVLGFAASLLTYMYLGRQCYLIFIAPPAEALRVFNRPPWLMSLSTITLALCTWDYWYIPAMDTTMRSGLWQQLQKTPLGAYAPPIAPTLPHDIASASTMILMVGLWGLIAWCTSSPASFRILGHPWAQQGWYLGWMADTVTKGIRYFGVGLAKLEQQIFHGVENRVWMSYKTLSKATARLDKHCYKLVLKLATIPLYGGTIQQKILHGNWQPALTWLLIGIGLLCWGIYRA